MKRRLLTGCSLVAILAAACGGGRSGNDSAPGVDPTPAAWFGQPGLRSFDVVYALTDEGLEGEHQLRWARGDYNERIDYAFNIDGSVYGSTTVRGPWIHDSTCDWRTEDNSTYSVRCPGVASVYDDILSAIFGDETSVRFDGSEVMFEVSAQCYLGGGGGRTSYWQAEFRACLSATGVPLLIEADADAAGGQAAAVRLVALAWSESPASGWDTQVVDVTADASQVDVRGVQADTIRLPDMPLLFARE